MAKEQTKKKHMKKIDRRISVAPMMGWTDMHDRYFLRLIAPNILLYTVMITTGALYFGKKEHVLAFNDPEEHPLALQLGGCVPEELAYSAKLADKYNYDEINLNCGCPSPRVQKGAFGACLMKEPSLVADCVDAMKQVSDTPITVKCRIGVDEYEGYDFLCDFIGQSAEKGCETFYIHARKAWLEGLSPKDNRTIPPLDWAMVHRLKKDHPDLEIIINGGIKTIEECKMHLEHVDGVMIGREAYQNPYLLSALEAEIYGTENLRSREEVIEVLIPYITQSMDNGIAIKDITRHILGLYKGQRGGRKWRQVLSEGAYKKDANIDLLRIAVNAMND